MRRTLLIALIVVLVAGAGVAGFARHGVVHAVLSAAAGLSTGYSIEFRDQRLGSDHGAIFDVHVRSREGEPVLDARRIDVWYSLRDLLPGSRHRYGITAVAIAAPVVTLIKHRDGSYNVHVPQAAPEEPQLPAAPNAVPIALTVRVRDASGVLLAPYAADPSARRIGLRGVALDASINTLFRTQYRIDGAFDQASPQPFHARGLIDMTRGYAMHHAYAGAIPLRAIGNFIINQETSRILGGNASHFDARAYALGFSATVPPRYHIGANVDVSDGQMQIIGLARPLEHIRGTLQLVDDAFFAPSLDARVANVPVRVSGGIYDFAQPQFALALEGRGELEALRTVLAFSTAEPVHGIAQIGTLVEGSVVNPVLAVSLESQRAWYRGIPLDDVRVNLALQNGIVTIAPLLGRAGDARFAVRGTLALGPSVQSTLVAHLEGPASSLPYAGTVLGDEPMIGDAVLSGDGLNFSGSGAIVSRIDPARAGAVFALARDGILDVEPAWATVDGRLAARYSLDRKNDRSAFWMSAQHLRLQRPSRTPVVAAALPGVPPLDGRIDDLLVAGGGTSGTTAVAGGRIAVRGVHVAGVDLATLETGFAGTLAGMAARGVRASGSWGYIVGDGSFSSSEFAINGVYRGTLEGLRPYLGGVDARGSLAGPAALAYRDGIVTVSSPGLQVAGTVRNVPVEFVAGTAQAGNGIVTVDSARAHLAGGDAVLAGSYATAPGIAVPTPLAVVATHLSGAELHASGLPIDQGVIDASGIVRAGRAAPGFDGVIAVARGRSRAFAVAGTGAVRFDGESLRVDEALGSLDGTYAFMTGDLLDVSSGAPAYALRAHVPAGDIPSTLRTFHVSLVPTTGTYAGDLAIGGNGAAPTVAGPVTIAAGTLNGLPYTRAQALFSADTRGAAADAGSATVGTTNLRFSAAARPQLMAAALSAPRADLADFNNFFDTGDTLGGTGAVRFSAAARDRTISSSGLVDVEAFRYRSLPFGSVDAAWTSRGGDVRASLAAGGPKGQLHAQGSIALAPSLQWQGVLGGSRYDVHADLHDLDLGYWLAAVGLPEIPVAGRVDGAADVRGRYPALSIVGNVSLFDGLAYRLPIQSLSARVSPAGGSRIRIDDAHLSSQAVNVNAHGTLGLRPHDSLDLQVAATTNDLPRLTELWTHSAIPVTGLFEATAHVAGTVDAPRFSGGFDAANATIAGVRVPSLFGGIALEGNRLQLKSAGATFEHGDVEIAGTLPLQLRPFAVGPPGSPISFSLAVNDLDPAVFDALLGNHTRLGGTVNGNVGIGGTVRAPRIAGTFSVRGGSYVSDLERSPITAIAAQLNFDATQATVSQLSARLGSGTLAGSGTVLFPDRGLGLGYTVDARAKGAQLDFPQYGRGSLTGALRLTKAPEERLATLGGQVDVNDATIPFAAFLGLGGGGAAAPGVAGPPIDVAFDLGLKAGRNVRIRGSGLGAGLDVGATGAVRLGGDLLAPTLDGRFDSTSGTLTYFDRAFRVQSAYVLFDKTSGLVPELHAVGSTHVVNPDPDRARNPYGSVDVTIKVDGLIDNLKIGFESNPPGYSREQIIALIAPFGGFIGGVNFGTANNGTLGAFSNGTPGADPLPGLLKPTNYGTITLGQEAFNILNAQFASGLLSPLENGLSQGLGLSDFSLTVDYYGNVGFSARKQLGRFVNLVYASTFGIPNRQSYGLEYTPSDVTSAQLSFFFQNGPERLFATPAGGGTTNARLTTGLPLTGQSGFSFTLQRLFW